MRRLLAAALAVTAVTGCGGSGLDAHAKTACDLVANMDAGADTGDFSGALDELKAVGEAGKSTVAGLRRAARKTSPAATLDYNSPLYENPADVAFNAVAAWCRQHA
jgi:hypothetical protein